jgi:GAF domain-containing protein
MVDRGRRILRASSCAFYVQDPIWKGDFRLVALPGVNFPGTMHGFLTSETSKEVVAQGLPETFVVNARQDPLRRSTTLDGSENIAPSLRHLFGDFVDREKVVSSARLLHVSGQNVQASLFVNYNRKRTFGVGLKKQMRSLLKRLVPFLADLSQELRDQDAPSIQQMIGALRPAQELATIGFGDPDQLKKYFERILESAMDVANLSEANGIGTIHLYQKSTEMLSLETHRGTIKYMERANRHSVRDGQGVISWVVRRRRAVLINDVKSSPFFKKGVYVPFRDNIRSELVVPMLAGETMLGVLNLESVDKDHFSNQDVRAIGYLANAAAVAARLSQEAATSSKLALLNKRLLDVLCGIPKTSQAVRSAIPEVAKLASDWLGGDRCVMWFYDPDRAQPFYDAGATDDTLQAKTDHPRLDGWSQYICRHKCYVWITNIANLPAEALIWEHDNRTWRQPAEADQIPAELNHQVLVRGVPFHLGIPILVREGDCIGIAWVEFDAPVQPLEESYMHLAEGFAGGAGLIMESLRLRAAEVRNKPEPFLLKTLEDALFPTSSGPLPAMSLQELEGYVIRKVHRGQLGGDFYACVNLNSHSVGILVGDGKAKGATGALFMLPMITAFRMCCMESRSPSHVIERVAATCSNTSIQAEGTAIYFVIRKINDKILLSVSSAGHPPLAIISTSKGFFELPGPKSSAKGVPINPNLDFSVGEESVELGRGDIVIAYTDGISEAGSESRLPNAKVMSAGGIHSAAEYVASGSPDEIARSIFRHAEECEQPLLDDATVLVLRVK